MNRAFVIGVKVTPGQQQQKSDTWTAKKGNQRNSKIKNTLTKFHVIGKFTIYSLVLIMTNKIGD